MSRRFFGALLLATLAGSFKESGKRD